MKQEKEITSMLDSDPLIKLKAQEIRFEGSWTNFRKKQKKLKQELTLDKAKLVAK